MTFKSLTASLGLASLVLFSTDAFSASRSQRIWQNYYPDTNCDKHECARSVPSAALEGLLEKASYHDPDRLNRITWMMVADFTQNSKRKRGYLINSKTGTVTRYRVSHGSGSGDGRGNAIRFSNVPNSKASSRGLYLTAETYFGKHGYSLRMDGLESTNSKARSRAIVIHGADYMSSAFVKAQGRSGRSWGCPAIERSLSRKLIDRLKGGSFYYIHGR